MEADAPEFHDLGTKRLFEVVLHEVFRKRQLVLADDVEKYCVSRVLRSLPQLRCALQFLEWLLVLRREDSFIGPAARFARLVDTSSMESFEVRLATVLLLRLAETRYFPIVFSDGALAQEPRSGILYVATSKVPLRYMPLVVLLRNLGLLQDSASGTGLLVVDPRISPVLADLARASSYVRKSGRAMTLHALKAQLEAQERQGTAAEHFVVAYERRRLGAHPRAELIRSIASEDVAAGFDIVSYETDFSLMFDRFIEVKSFRATAAFYWSRNEREVARRLGNSYCIYLVDMERVLDPIYHPLIIRNPADTLGDAWVLEAENWLVREVQK
jgi:hypothetical protein